MPNAKSTILFISLAKKFGGGEVQTELLIQNIRQLGFDVAFYGKANGVLGQKLAKQSILVLPNLWTVGQFLRQHSSVLIHACDGRSVHLAAALKFCFKKPLLITRHVIFPLKRKSSQISYRYADAVVGVSQTASDKLKSLNAQTHTIYGGIEKLREHKSIDAYFQSAPNTLKVAQIGNFQAVKNFPLTIELAKSLPSVQFYLVGSGELEQELKTAAKDVANITFVPFTPYIGSVFKQVDVQILPSHSEGLSMVILEGYQYDVPILAHAVGGIPEIVEHGKTGYLIEHNQMEDYRVYLLELSKQPAQLAKLKQSTALYWQQRDFSGKRMAQEYVQLYKKLL
ncbi:glycosyltransferase family 4 protein [Kingella kingae]|uniref:glycosyltransferase family 4 protein n=1 Tax=Kingella kingae TaxID=504 RepID=UPI00040B011B|nr:glycosyltransferase family 4 protein [Kingella kingae]MBD3614103.1 glycosyltransferase family 4 protein [Kingella kingae]MBD3632421.1 glycosyltransferase family 4 protein [Kingella kingae]MBD3659814.1 glycosyltransferase family 4 protein [Kingella kingae]MDK4586035.1 glycosyltransferase family 4 protein [Kingella kingae]MDK4604162.1 glycosyltransferase family 4 protein [Kingella kingae]